jgi:uncharacterized protein
MPEYRSAWLPGGTESAEKASGLSDEVLASTMTPWPCCFSTVLAANVMNVTVGRPTAVRSAPDDLVPPPPAIRALLLCAVVPVCHAGAEGPSFECRNVDAGSIEEMVCTDSALAALDRKLARVYAEAARKATNEHPPVLKVAQRGWVKGRDDCWKDDDRRPCVEASYIRRIAELQASYRLVPATGPVFYACDGQAANEVVVTFFKTDPPVPIAERGDSVSLMFAEPAGSGATYAGRNESFREHQGEARVIWGFGAPAMSCTAKK